MRLDNKNFKLFVCKGVGSNFDKDNKLNQMTNADKIRSMTDEELANYLCEIIDCEVCKSFIIKNEVCNCKNRFPQGILEWLKGSVGDNENGCV